MVSGTGLLPTYIPLSGSGVKRRVLAQTPARHGILDGPAADAMIGENVGLFHLRLRLEFRLVLHVVPHLQRRIALDHRTPG